MTTHDVFFLHEIVLGLPVCRIARIPVYRYTRDNTSWAGKGKRGNDAKASCFRLPMGRSSESTAPAAGPRATEAKSHSVHQSRRRGPAARVGNAENHGTANRSGRRSLWSLARAKRLRLANYMYHSKSASRSRTSARFRPTKYISSGCSSFGHKFDRQCSTSKKRARRV